MKDAFLIFSIALNGYQQLYKKNLDSQQRYAKRLGATYISVTKPFFSKLGVECCWLKLTLLKEALLSGYDQVLFLDADTEVTEDCPDIRENLQPEKHWYMAKGYTNRFNSGVILLNKAPEVILLLQKLIDARFKPIPEQDSVGWGENGHIIHFTKALPFVVSIDHRWNNTYDACCTDFIRHYNFGPMRDSLCRNWLHKALSVTSRQLNKCSQWLSGSQYQQRQQAILSAETRQIIHLYPQFVCQTSPKIQSDFQFRKSFAKCDDI